MAQWSQWGAYRKPPSLLPMVWAMTPIRPPFPLKRELQMHPSWHVESRVATSPHRVIWSTSCSFQVGFSVSADRFSAIPGSIKFKMVTGWHLEWSNGHISAMGDTIHFMFGSMVRFTGSADRMALFSVLSNQDGGFRRRLMPAPPYQWKFTAASRGFLATAWLSCFVYRHVFWVVERMCAPIDDPEKPSSGLTSAALPIEFSRNHRVMLFV